ncbi:MAG: hypothetical protein EOO75_15670, partial [Myxococcales bacterium]
LAGPVGGRALAAYGADVMLVNSPHLPNIEAIADTSRGKRSAHVDLRKATGRAAMDALLDEAHVFVQGYRPGGLQSLGYGPLASDVQMSPRIASPLQGGGLLEAIAASDLLALADPDDADGDGISGRPNWLPDGAGGQVLGRFGWKSNQPSLLVQNATAFQNDLGLTSPLLPTEVCTPAQTACLAAPTGGSPELAAGRVEQVTRYTRSLAVPYRPGASDPEVLAGKAIFASVGCTGCHHPSFTTPDDPSAPWLSAQTIWPYTDLLLHDLGPGLADDRPDHEASGREWRTPPLWGLGRTKAVSGHTRFLHDGRARSVLEAILWHGGEAQGAREAVRQLDAGQRQALLRFLGSL